jgi:uncharacterized protein DUF4386
MSIASIRPSRTVRNATAKSSPSRREIQPGAPCYLMLRSGLVPRRLALLELVGGPLAIAAATGALFGVYDRQSAPQFLLTVPEIVWEAFFGLYLVVNGFPTAARTRPVGGLPAAVPAAAQG